MLLDLSSTSWRILYSNDCFSQAVGMPELAPGHGCEVVRSSNGSNKPSSRNFWQLFAHVTAGTRTSFNVSCLTHLDTHKQCSAAAAHSTNHPCLTCLSCLRLLNPHFASTPAMQASVMAIAAGKEFSMRVQPILGGRGSEYSMTSLEAEDGGAQQALPVLLMRFLPADSEQLRAGMPHIGIPAWADSESAEGCRLRRASIAARWRLRRA